VEPLGAADEAERQQWRSSAGENRRTEKIARQTAEGNRKPEGATVEIGIREGVAREPEAIARPARRWVREEVEN